MPIYEYCCEKGHSFEMLQKIGDPPLEKCPFCSAKARRKVSLPTLVKGAGIYLFDKKFGTKDILHDPTFSDRERGEIISEIQRQGYGSGL